ncbi:MAG TPA: ferritin-like domain-containing protein [Thermoleophilaceae bacterium]|nr:ferritin-like domain-containing protein [Thermoleophilaceae bacterium]
MTLTRRCLLATGALLAIAVPARAQERSDSEILEDLLVLEGRLVTAYEAALRRDVIEAGLGETLRDQEREHVRGLEQALGAAGGGSAKATVPEPALGRALRGRAAFTAYALELEREAVSAYIEAASGIGREGLRQPLGSILACEAAHQVALRASVDDSLLEVE